LAFRYLWILLNEINHRFLVKAKLFSWFINYDRKKFTSAGIGLVAGLKETALPSKVFDFLQHYFRKKTSQAIIQFRGSVYTRGLSGRILQPKAVFLVMCDPFMNELWAI
jgi:hypothetical protein